MESEDKCRLLAKELKKIICSGLTVSTEVIHYIDSTFANPATTELQTILSDDSNCEKDSLMELLFFPDESIQVQLEDLLEELQLQKQHEKIVLAYLMEKPLQVTIHFQDERLPLKLIVPDSIAAQFLTRLKIFKHLNERLIEAMDQHGDEENCSRFKVNIRNSRFSQTENTIGFLCEFFRKMEPQNHEVFECLDFVVEFLDELIKDDNIYQALAAKKRSYVLSLQKAKQLNAQLQKNNMETLLLQGKRVVIIDQADVRNKMLMIDRISRSVFGKTEYFGPLHSNEASVEFRSDQDIKKIISALS
ncbi:MAG: hypothetical protein HKO68_15915 [Desulfobacterales bacterium]|nr:hypothetical protein [Desulfobacterales bacterium]